MSARLTLKGGGTLDILRRAAGLTVGDLFRKSGVPEKTLERILAGRNKPTVDHFLAIIRALGVEDVVNTFDAEDFE